MEDKLPPKDNDSDILKEYDAFVEKSAKEGSPESGDAPVSDEAVKSIIKEIDDEAKFGDKPIQTATESFASGLTLGLSDQFLTKTGIMKRSDLRERRERNKTAAITGEVAAVLATLPTGGAGLVGKGARAASKFTPLGAALKAGRTTEKVVGEKLLREAIQKSGNPSLAKSVIRKTLPAAAGSAVEGAAFGTGQLISEDALGTAEFNAENLMASAGFGAVLGAGAGTVFGAGAALLPEMSKKLSKKSANIILQDAEEAALELAIPSLGARQSLKNRRPDVVRELADFMREEIKVNPLTSTSNLLERFKRVNSSAANELSTVSKALSKAEAAAPHLLPSRADVSQRIAQVLDEKFIIPKAGKKSFKSHLKKVLDIKEDVLALAKKGGQATTAELNVLRKEMDQLAKLSKEPMKATLGEQAAYAARSELRSVINETAEKISRDSTDEATKTLADRLLKANKDFSLTSEIIPHLDKKLGRESAFTLTDILIGGLGAGALQDPSAGVAIAFGNKLLKSDFRRKLSIVMAGESAAKKVGSKISGSVKSFLSNKRVPVSSLSTKVLVETALSSEFVPGELPKKAKTKKQAFENIAVNLDKATKDPEFLSNKILSSTMAVHRAAPKAATAIAETTVKGVQFLESKIPETVKNAQEYPFLNRKPEPSSMEIAKFERYLQGVENPLSIMDELAAGTLTREHVEAVREVYPDLYGRIQTNIMEQVATSQTDLSYSNRILLGNLFEIQTDPSLQTDSIIGLQSNFGQKQEEAKAGQSAVKPTQSGLKDVDIAKRAQSGSESVATRRQ